MARGTGPANVETIHDELKYDVTTKFYSFCPASVVSGVDIALWDLYGKAVGEPVSRLIGGRVRDDVRAYASGHFWPPVEDFEELRETVVEEARGHVDAGFDALKNKTGLRNIFGWAPRKTSSSSAPSASRSATTSGDD